MIFLPSIRIRVHFATDCHPAIHSLKRESVLQHVTTDSGKEGQLWMDLEITEKELHMDREAEASEGRGLQYRPPFFLGLSSSAHSWGLLPPAEAAELLWEGVRLDKSLVLL